MKNQENRKNYRFVENWIKENWDELEFRRKLKQAKKWHLKKKIDLKNRRYN